MTIIETTEGHSLRLDIPCSALKDGRCELFGKPERPSFCSTYPEWPGALTGLPQPERCVYEFERIK